VASTAFTKNEFAEAALIIERVKVNIQVLNFVVILWEKNPTLQ
jgi:hypothetical protein